MNKIYSVIISCALLYGCGDASQSPKESKYIITYPESISDGQKDKIAIDDIYIIDSKKQDMIVVDYHFKQCWFNDAASFADTYLDTMFVNSIEAPHSDHEFEECDAQSTSKLLSMTYANIKVGYEIKDYKEDGEDDFKLTLALRDSPTLKLYEIDGIIHDLRVEKE